MMFRARPVLWVTLLAALYLTPAAAVACGCFHPPVPDAAMDDDFAVNQQAEQIIFEVNDNDTITAHVQISYQGDPAQFAWLVPTPSDPVLELGDAMIFTILNYLTTPTFDRVQMNACPQPKYLCEFHEYYGCNNGASNNGSLNNGFNNGASGNGGDADAVTVIARQQIGSYDTVTFAATDATAAVTWLQDEGFIVNQTMSPYLQPYLDAGMYFVASKLIPGAGVDEIRPLKMTYNATEPMIPLKLTAIAAEPHLTVTTFIMGGSTYTPIDQPVVDVPSEELGWANERGNYAMLMSRLIDEQGGKGFVREFGGALPLLGVDSECCGEFDSCFIGGDSQCQCPGAEFEDEDCAEFVDGEEWRAAEVVYEALRTKHAALTRITTRVSAEEMTFDPMFSRDADIAEMQRRVERVEDFSLEACIGDIAPGNTADDVATINEDSACSAVYCGRGECAIAADGTAGCVCETGFRARQYTELDGELSVTCVPDVGTVDLAAGGITLPDACKGRTCGASGTCEGIQGFPVCDCGTDMAVVASDSNTPTCVSPARLIGDSGARNYNKALLDIDVCEQSAPICRGGWLVTNVNRRFTGVSCGDDPAPERFVVPPREDRDDGCGDYYEPDGTDKKQLKGGGCSSAPFSPADAGWLVLIGGLVWGWRRKASR